jgi:DNA-binding XRE family transcriptional regulator
MQNIREIKKCAKIFQKTLALTVGIGRLMVSRGKAE